jgi:hypothetical protein
MDHAVALVQTYLQLNGYFTTAEYPVIEALEKGGYRSVTDIDILGFRLPFAPRGRSRRANALFQVPQPDPILRVPKDAVDLLIGEVKEGKTHLNEPATDRAVLRSVIQRFGYTGDVETAIDEILRNGYSPATNGTQIRLVVFGGLPRGVPSFPCELISLGHILKFLQDYVRQHWQMLRHIQFKDPAFGFLITLEKAKRGERRTRVKELPGVPPRRATDNDPREVEVLSANSLHHPRVEMERLPRRPRPRGKRPVRT